MDWIVASSGQAPIPLYQGPDEIVAEADAFHQMTQGQHRTNKSQVLRQLALKRKLEKRIFDHQQESMKLVLDSYSEQVKSPQMVRKRDRRGVYQSVELEQVPEDDDAEML